MENPEEILHSLEEFAKMKPKDIPRELEEYLKFVAKTGDPIYQWPAIKSLFREKLVSVITEFYESCPSIEIPPCPNVDMFNYDLMKSFILEKLDTFPSAPFTLQRICELLTSPHKEYTRIDKYMRALEKNILVVSTMEPGGRRTENGEGIMNGIESDHEQVPEPSNVINVEEMDDSPYIQAANHITEHIAFDNSKSSNTDIEIENSVDTFTSDKISSEASTSSQDIVCVQYVSIEPVIDNPQNLIEETKEPEISVTITAINIIDDDRSKPQVVEHDDQPKTTIIEDVSRNMEALIENIEKPDIKIKLDVQMETENAEPVVRVPEIENEATPTTTLELYQPEPEAVPVSCENSEMATTSSSETSSSESISEPSSSSNICAELVDSAVKGPVENQPEADKLEQESSNIIDSTTDAPEDSSLKHEVSTSHESNPRESDMAIVPPEVASEPLTPCPDEEKNPLPLDSSESEEPAEDISNPLSITEIEELATPAEKKSEDSDEPDSAIESKIEEISSLPEQKDAPMELDAVPEKNSDASANDDTLTEEPDSSQALDTP